MTKQERTAIEQSSGVEYQMKKHAEHQQPPSQPEAGRQHASLQVEMMSQIAMSPQYPAPLVFAVNMFALCIAVFCVALDNTVLSTAIPVITNQFHALQHVGWYGSAYFLTTCAFQLPFGKIYRLCNPKWTFMVTLIIFELGSLVCALAPNSISLIIGRCIAGVGAAGVFSGALIIIAHTSPMEKRPVWQSLLSGMFGIASILGPVIGGAFTDHVSWRWCFWINLPLGGITAVIIACFLHLAVPSSPTRKKSLWKIVWSLDPLGFVLFFPSMICLFMALQWGGTTYAWSDAHVIALFVVFGITLIAFIGVQVWLGEAATIPPRIATQRTIVSASWYAFFLTGGYFLYIYFLPIYFQAIKGTTALQSGIDNIPRLLANVLTIMTSGWLLSKIGYYNPFIYASVLLSSIGSGLLTTLTPQTSAGRWAGYQILYGIGSGMGFQQPPNAAQAILPFEDLPTGIAITLFFRNFGGAIFINVGNNVLNSALLSRLSNSAIPGISPEAVLESGATSFRQVIVSTDVLASVLDIYNQALQQVFQVGLIVSCLSGIGAVLMECRSVKSKAIATEDKSSTDQTNWPQGNSNNDVEKFETAATTMTNAEGDISSRGRRSERR